MKVQKASQRPKEANSSSEFKVLRTKRIFGESFSLSRCLLVLFLGRIQKKTVSEWRNNMIKCAMVGRANFLIAERLKSRPMIRKTDGKMVCSFRLNGKHVLSVSIETEEGTIIGLKMKQDLMVLYRQ